MASLLQNLLIFLLWCLVWAGQAEPQNNAAPVQNNAAAIQDNAAAAQPIMVVRPRSPLVERVRQQDLLRQSPSDRCHAAPRQRQRPAQRQRSRSELPSPDSPRVRVFGRAEGAQSDSVPRRALGCQ